MNQKLRKAVLGLLGTAALAGVSSQAFAISTTNLGTFTGAALSLNTSAPYRAFSDYGTTSNYGWTHTAKWLALTVGTAADIASGARFNLALEMKARGTTAPMNNPGFAVFTSGSAPLVAGSANGYGHMWSPVRGPRDGGVGGDPENLAGDAGLGTNGWMGVYGDGNIVEGHNGWVGYANAGYSYKTGDGDTIAGRLAGASATGTAVANVNSGSPYVNGGFATLAAGDAMLTLYGLKAGYYLIGTGGVCPDNNANGQGCATPPAVPARTYTMTVNQVAAPAPVPLPAAVWLFGSALAGLGVFRRKGKASA